MRQINPEHVRMLLAFVNSGPYFELLSMKVCEIKPAYARVEVDLRKEHLNNFGGIHGGVYASLIDTAAYWSVYHDMGEETGYTSIDLSVSNLSMVDGGKIVVEGHAIKMGRSICLAEAEAKDEGGKLLAHGISKLMVLAGRQSVPQAVVSRGFPALPPKFI